MHLIHFIRTEFYYFILNISDIMRKPVLCYIYVSNKDADQPMHLRSLIGVFIPPANCACVCVCGGGILFSRCPSIRDALVFQYLEKAMMEFHQIWQIH